MKYLTILIHARFEHFFSFIFLNRYFNARITLPAKISLNYNLISPCADPEGGGGRGLDPPPPLEIYEKKCFLVILVRIPLKTTKLPSQHSCRAIIGPPAKRHKIGPPAKRPKKKICWHFWVHFGIHAQSVYWCVPRRIGVDAKSGNAPKSQN